MQAIKSAGGTEQEASTPVDISDSFRLRSSLQEAVMGERYATHALSRAVVHECYITNYYPIKNCPNLRIMRESLSEAAYAAYTMGLLSFICHIPSHTGELKNYKSHVLWLINEVFPLCNFLWLCSTPGCLGCCSERQEHDHSTAR